MTSSKPRVVLVVLVLSLMLSVPVQTAAARSDVGFAPNHPPIWSHLCPSGDSVKTESDVDGGTIAACIQGVPGFYLWKDVCPSGDFVKIAPLADGWHLVACEAGQ